MEEDNSLEFDMFEEVRRNLTQVLVREGRELIDAERIALYVVQGVREVPKFLTALVRSNKPDKEILVALLTVLNNAATLDKARNILLNLDDKIVH
ncbi:MAG TPA: hypothetical protein VNA19_04225 [Pyrinomonadaceae bacterium]|jgi:hypothetical protein|nr:hypothetical protein [Pyrinomonadaceae bacterium]